MDYFSVASDSKIEFGDYEMITGVSGATYLRVSGTANLAGTLQAGQYILATGLAYGAVNSYTQIINGSTGAITGTSASFSASITASGNSNSFGNTTIAALSATSGTFSASVTAAGNSNSFGGTTFSNVLTINPGSSTVATETFRRDTNGDGQIIGDINFNTTAAEGTDDRIGLIRSRTSGGAATSRGGELLFYTRKSGSADFNLTTYDKDGNWTFPGSVTFTSNIYADRYYADTTTKQTDALFIGRQNGNIVEFGHNNQSAQYYGVLGVQGSSGYPFVGFSCDVDYGANTFTTRGAKGNVIQGSAGNLSFQTVDNTNATGQTPNTRMFIKNDGNVGIGTTSPTSVLHIKDNSASPTQLSIQSNDFSRAEEINFLNPSTSAISGQIKYYTNPTVEYMSFSTSNNSAAAQRMLIDGGGSIIIGAGGTSGTPSADYRSLEIGRQGNTITGAPWKSNLYFSTNATITAGSTTFTARYLNELPMLYAMEDGIFTWSSASLPSSVGDTVTFSEKMRITAGGDVGIGTTSPGTKLDIGGMADPTVRIKSDAGGDPELRFDAAQANRSARIKFYDNGSSVGGFIDYLHNGDKMNFGAGSSTGVTMTVADGDVGIGTDSPLTTLHVNKSSDAQVLVQGTNKMALHQDAAWNSNILLGCYYDGSNIVYGSTNRGAFKIVGLHDSTTQPQTLSIYGANGASPAGSTVTFNSVGFSQDEDGNVGIGTTSPNYNLEIGGTANPKIAIVSNINSATSSLLFGDSDAKDRGQVAYTHFGDFMELKAGGATRVYIESGINTAYTSDGLFNSNATPSYWNHGNGQFKLGYMDNGSGLYSGAYCFNVKSTDGIPVTGREIGAIYVRDTSNNRMPLIISNQGRINLNQTNTSASYGSSTGWISIQNGTGAYNIFNYYTGTDGGSGCARYRVDNTSPSFFDFYYSTTQVGYITTNGTDIFYANTSDYRLKEDLKSFDGMSLLEQIQVYDFKWKESDNRMYGVVAHELQEVIPQAVVGNKDEEKLQAVDYSKLVPVLIKSIQELEARVKELENN